MKKIALFSVLGLLLAATASAHVTVKPDSVPFASSQTFTVGVPTEKDIPTVAVRLVLPEGLENVTPYVKTGWSIEIKQVPTGNKVTEHGMEHDEMKPTEIIWTRGQIPAGQRDDFNFRARVPAQEAKFVWKAYQTYSDGSVVAWDAEPTEGEAPEGAPGPFSVTKVINDLQNEPAETSSKETDSRANTALVISIVALVLAIVKFRRQ